MKKALVLTMTILLVFSGMVLAQHEWIEKSGDSDSDGNVEIKEFIFKADGSGMHGEFFGDRGRGCGDRGGYGSCDKHGNRGGHRGQRGGDGFGLKMLHTLEGDLALSEKQQKQIKEMQYKFKLEMIDAKAELQKANAKLQMLKHEDDSSESDIFSAIDEQAGLKANMAKMKYKHHNGFNSILSEKQIQKIKELHGNKGVKGIEHGMKKLKFRRKIGG